MLLKQSFRFCRRAAVEPHKQGAGSTQAGQSRAHTHHRKGARPKTNTCTTRHTQTQTLLSPYMPRVHQDMWCVTLPSVEQTEQKRPHSRSNRPKNVTPKVQISAARRYNRSDAAPHVNRSPSRKKISQWQHIFFFFPPPDKQRRPKP